MNESFQIWWSRFIERAGDTSRIEMCLLALGSFWILATILRLRRSVVAPAQVCQRLADLLRQGDTAGAVTLCRRDSSFVARVLRDFIPIAPRSASPSHDLARIEERELGSLRRARNPILWLAWLAILVGLVGGISRFSYELQVQYQQFSGVPPEAHPIPYRGMWEALQHVAEGLVVATLLFPWAWWLRDRAEVQGEEARVFVRGVLASLDPSAPAASAAVPMTALSITDSPPNA